LLSNAVKFTPRGGRVALTADLAQGARIDLSVTDTGIGMEPESIPLALEPFRQIDSPMSRTVEGTGLGLALVKALAERHGAALRIESKVDHGTTARVLFPADRTVTKLAAKARA
jgi:signal transduction histidine kinase